jgi:ADP-heptose:LPS heptosyltransferase
MTQTKRFGIIQLTRMGDLLQTYQACRDFRFSFPEVKLTLIARKEFAEPLRLILEEVFDDIVLLSKSELNSGEANNLSQYIENINTWLKKPQLQNIDILMNFSFCQTSNYLSRLIPVEHRLGTYIDNFNQVSVKDQWSQIVYSMVMNGPYCAFSLVDIYKNILGTRTDLTKDLPPSLSQTENKERAGLNALAIHPFASSTKKRWKPSKWGEIIYKALKDNPGLKVHLFGAKNEQAPSREILNSSVLKKFADRIENHVGQLSVYETYQKLGECSYFIGHDSLLGHLAKLHQLPTLTVALGTVRPIETTPYGNNSFVLSPKTKCFPCFPDTDCNFFQCHADISYQAVAEVLNNFLQGEMDISKIEKTVSPFHLDSLDIFEFAPTSQGWFILDKKGGGSPAFRDVMKDIYRTALSYKLEEVEENISLPELTPSHIEKLRHILSGIEQYYELCEFGKKYSRFILTEVGQDQPNVKDIKEFGNKIDDIDRLQDLLKKTYPELGSIIDFYKVVKSNLQGENIVEISESSYIVYNDNGILCSIIFDLIQSIVNKHDIKSGRKASTKEGSA